MMNEATRNCFVCLESSGELFRVCKCSTLVHADCFDQLVRSVESHNTGCAICLTAYKTVNVASCFLYLCILFHGVNAFLWAGITVSALNPEQVSFPASWFVISLIFAYVSTESLCRNLRAVRNLSPVVCGAREQHDAAITKGDER